MSQKRKYRLVYFKAWNGPRNVGGKFYSESDYESGASWEDLLAQVEALQRQGSLPGLVVGHSAYHVVVEDMENAVPHLLLHPSTTKEAPDPARAALLGAAGRALDMAKRMVDKNDVLAAVDLAVECLKSYRGAA